MKKLLFSFIFIVIFTFTAIIFFKANKSENIPQTPADTTPTNIQNSTPTQNKAQPQDSSGQGYKTVWISVNDKDKLFLYTNLENKLSSKELATKHSCAQLISGGFYDTQGNHIGLLVSEGEIISDSQKNDLFNAYFSISKTNVISITEYPIFSPRISLQTGPFLFKNKNKVNLNLVRDENARRIAVGITEDKKIMFFAFYEQENYFSGPELAELSELIERINKEKKLSLVDVINLDGGAHSAFISDLVTLSEASPIGSFFCLKP